MFKGPFCGPFFCGAGSSDWPLFSGILKAFLQSSDKARNSYITFKTSCWSGFILSPNLLQILIGEDVLRTEHISAWRTLN